MNMDMLSIKEKIGQKFIFGVNSGDVNAIIELIENCSIGGIILYKRNYTSYFEMLEVIKKFKIANKNNKVPLFISIDQENGKVNRLPNEIHPIKNMSAVSLADKNLVKDVASLTSEILIESGINMNFAPVLDIYNGSKSKALYKRCFSGNVDDISQCASYYVDCFRKNGVISVVKHFPGHGATTVDSHFMVPYVHNYRDVMTKHMIPFEKSIQNGVDAVMVGHLIVRNLTYGWPASASLEFIKKYIRDKYDYDNLIITDEVNMLQNKLLYRYDKYLEKVFLADNDIILAKIKNANEGYSIIKKYLNLIKDNNDLRNQIDMSVERILRIKKKYKINDSINYGGIDIKKINQRIDKVNNLVNDN